MEKEIKEKEKEEEVSEEISNECEQKAEEKEAVEELGLHTIKNTFEEELDETNTKFYYGSLRSGQKLEYNGSIVVVGDVNSGAEVFALGNIAVLGSLRGIAHAGASGNIKAVISATEINTPQLRIANIVKEMEQCPDNGRVVVKVKDGKIIFE